MRLFRILMLFLTLFGAIACSTPQVRRRPINKSEIRQHSNQNMQEMQRSLKEQQE